MTLKQFKSLKKKSKGSVAYGKRKSLKSALMKVADAKWSSAVKVKAEMVCEKCRSVKGLQSHHIFTRSIKSVRHYVPNGVCLCAGHHKFFAHSQPHAFRDWITSVRGQEWWDDLSSKARIRTLNKVKF